MFVCCVYALISIGVHICIYVQCICAHAYGGQRSMLVIIPQLLALLCFKKQGLSVNMKVMLDRLAVL